MEMETVRHEHELGDIDVADFDQVYLGTPQRPRAHDLYRWPATVRATDLGCGVSLPPSRTLVVMVAEPHSPTRQRRVWAALQLGELVTGPG